MALNPTKTWEYTVNLVRSGGSITIRNQELWLALKDAIFGTGSVQAVDVLGVNISLTAPPIVIASSDSVTADSTDRWAVIADIVGAPAASPHSWIQGRFVDYFGSGDHLNFLMSCEDTADLANGFVSWVRGALGYNADGTTTSRPTPDVAETEVITRAGLSPAGDAKSSDVMWGSDSVNTQCVLHVRMSDDGQCGGWWVMAAGACLGFQGWQRDEEGAGSLDHINDFWVWAGSLDGTAEMNEWDSNSTWNSLSLLRSLDGADVEINAFVTMPVASGTEVPVIRDNAGNSRMMYPIYIIDISSGIPHGVFTDVLWGSALEASRDQSPASPPVVRSQIGEQVIYWPSGVDMLVA